MTRALVVVVAVALLAAPAAGAEFVTVDDHPLTDQAAIETYQSEGYVSANATRLDLGLTVAQRHETIGVDGFVTDFNRQFVCLDYREGLSREVRVVIPDDYIRPRAGESPSLTSDHTMHYAPTDDGNATAITVRFDGPGRACTGFTAGSGIYFDLKGDAREWMNGTTGWSPPSLTSGQQWDRVPTGAFSGNSTYELAADRPLTVQYDAGGNESVWLTVPDCSEPSEQVVCQYRAGQGANESVVLLSTAEDPPPIRYRYGGGLGADVQSAVRDFQQAIMRFINDIQNALAGGVL